ncbi:MAG: helix-turn-helix domain-containing protein [Candidatus Nanopelagicales bacterium]
MASLREHRESLGISQAHAAFLLGTSQPNVSTYEAGHLDGSALVAARVAAFLALRPDTLHAQSWLGTCASHARALKAASRSLRDSDRDDYALRAVIGMNDAFATACARGAARSDLEFFLIPPSTTGDAAMDALLQGMAAHWARTGGLERVPTWTRGAVAERMWWIGLPEGADTLRAAAYAHALPSLRARGIVLDRRALESV